MELLKIMGERLKALRENHHLTQKNMAELLDCTPSHYQKIEYGQVNVPATTLVLLSQKFQVTTDYLLGLSDER